MAFQNMAANTGGSYEPLQLEPFIHQVGGHSSMLQLDQDTICKPLSQMELEFYNSAPENIREFMAEYKGSIEVKFSEADDGYLDVTTYIPAPTSSKQSSRQKSHMPQSMENERKAKHRIRLCKPGSLQIDSIVYDELKQTYEECNRGKPQNGSLNPWVLRCHQKQMKKKLQTATTTLCQKYILLENRVSKYEFPSILDIKMGTRLYGDTMTSAKKQSHTAKAEATTSAILGARISGMKVYRPDLGRYTCYNKYYGQSLTVDGFHETLFEFLHDGVKLRSNILLALLEKLRKLHSVVQSLNTFRFFTSSLLIIYNGGKPYCNKNDAAGDQSITLQLADNGNVGKEKKTEDPLPKSCDKCSVSSGTTAGRKRNAARCTDKAGELPLVDLCMIDFAHSTHSEMKDSIVTHEGPDEGYLFGLENLIKHLEIIQQTEK